MATVGTTIGRPITPAGARAVQAKGLTGGLEPAAGATPVTATGRGPATGRPGPSALGRPGVVPIAVGLLRPRAGRAALPVPDAPGGLAVAATETGPRLQAVTRRRRAKVQARVEVMVRPPRGRPMGAPQAERRAPSGRGRHALGAKAGPELMAGTGPPRPVGRATTVRVAPAPMAAMARPITLAMAVDGEDVAAKPAVPVPVAIPAVAVLGGVEPDVEMPHARIATARTTTVVRRVAGAGSPTSAVAGATTSARAPEAAVPAAGPVAPPDRASQRQVPIDAVPSATATAAVARVAP